LIVASRPGAASNYPRLALDGQLIVETMPTIPARSTANLGSWPIDGGKKAAARLCLPPPQRVWPFSNPSLTAAQRSPPPFAAPWPRPMRFLLLAPLYKRGSAPSRHSKPALATEIRLVQPRCRLKLPPISMIWGPLFCRYGRQDDWCWSWAAGTVNSPGTGCRFQRQAQAKRRPPCRMRRLLTAASGKLQPCWAAPAGAAPPTTPPGKVGGAARMVFRRARSLRMN